MRWTVETLNASVDAEVRTLPKDIQAALLRLSERIEAVGLEQIGAPHVKHVRGKLWEMRLRDQDGIARALYVTATGRRVVILHVFSKRSWKIPSGALALAEQRAKEIRR